MVGQLGNVFTGRILSIKASMTYVCLRHKHFLMGNTPDRKVVQKAKRVEENCRKAQIEQWKFLWRLSLHLLSSPKLTNWAGCLCKDCWISANDPPFLLCAREKTTSKSTCVLQKPKRHPSKLVRGNGSLEKEFVLDFTSVGRSSGFVLRGAPSLSLPGTSLGW